ncbi:MAG: hypothetical protein ACO3QB_08760 [bacterium]
MDEPYCHVAGPIAALSQEELMRIGAMLLILLCAGKAHPGSGLRILLEEASAVGPWD